jgi:hypothetical protein
MLRGILGKFGPMAPPNHHRPDLQHPWSATRAVRPRSRSRRAR